MSSQSMAMVQERVTEMQQLSFDDESDSTWTQACSKFPQHVSVAHPSPSVF